VGLLFVPDIPRDFKLTNFVWISKTKSSHIPVKGAGWYNRMRVIGWPTSGVQIGFRGITVYHVLNVILNFFFSIFALMCPVVRNGRSVQAARLCCGRQFYPLKLTKVFNAKQLIFLSVNEPGIFPTPRKSENSCSRSLVCSTRNSNLKRRLKSGKICRTETRLFEMR